MKKYMFRLLSLTLILFFSNLLHASENESFVGRLYISNSFNKITYNELVPGSPVDTINNKDKVLFYHAHIMILNPTKNKFHVEVHCVDEKDRLVFKGVLDRTLDNYDLMNGIKMGEIIQQLEMDPTAGAMIDGQHMPLVNNNDYFFKLYVDNKLIGITRLHYLIKKSSIR